MKPGTAPMTSDLSPVDRLNEIRLRRLAAAEAWASTSLSWSETVERTIASSADVGWLLDHIEQLQGELDACRRWQAKRVVAISADPIFGAAVAEVEELRAQRQAVLGLCDKVELLPLHYAQTMELVRDLREALGVDRD